MKMYTVVYFFPDTVYIRKVALLLQKFLRRQTTRVEQASWVPKAAFTPGQHCPALATCCADEQHVACCRQHVACISATCIPLYPATDGQQIGNNFVAGNKQHLPWCKRDLRTDHTSYGQFRQRLQSFLLIERVRPLCFMNNCSIAL